MHIILDNIKSIAKRRKYWRYFFKILAGSLKEINNPYLWKEGYTFMLKQLFNHNRRVLASDEVLFETHSHIRTCNKSNLESVINILFERNVGIWALTNHNSDECFQNLYNGGIRIHNKNNREVSIEKDNDMRSLILNSEYLGVNRTIVMLRGQEKSTESGELGIIGYKNSMPGDKMTLKDTLEWAKNDGAIVIANHPFSINGIAYNTVHTLYMALESGVNFVELNAKSVGPLIINIAKLERMSSERNFALVVGSDAHTPKQYGINGVVIKKSDLTGRLKSTPEDYFGAIKSLMLSHKYENQLNYITIQSLLRSLDFNPNKQEFGDNFY